jgi:TusA-related sulfurtransferase
MIINSNTKIAPILKQNADALEAIISISPKFQKLRNPLLRKLMAGRTTLAAASRFGGCSINDFFKKLEPLGFEIDRDTKVVEEEKKPVPAFIISLSRKQIIELDVRPVISSGSDPLNIIMQKVKTIQPGQVLKIINTFEPTPLILMLEKKGFETYVDAINDNLIENYFHKTETKNLIEQDEKPATNDWDKVLKKFGDKIQNLDVRHLEMPQPMLTIVDSLDHLPNETVLFVYHKRIPVFLLPELAQRGFEYRIKEIKDGEVHLLIFRN